LRWRYQTVTVRIPAIDNNPELAILATSRGRVCGAFRNWRENLEGPLLGAQGKDFAPRNAASHVRRDSYRLLARRAVRHAAAPRRRPGPSSQRLKRDHAEPVVPTALEPLIVDLPRARDPFWSADVQIRCFGRFELSRQGVAVQRWRRRSAERLLKFLLVNGRRAHRDVLLDVLWPDVPSKSSIPGLRVTLHALRRAIAAVAPEQPSTELIKAEGDTYVLNTAGLWIDSDAFDEHYSAGLRLERLNRLDAAVREYSAAEALYRDDFLVEDLYEDWTVLPREELKDKYLLILTKLAEFSMSAMDLDGCIRRSHALLAKEPCREDAYQRLMQCYARLGQRGSAIRWYQICERTLNQELDVAPSEETRRLYRELASASV